MYTGSLPAVSNREDWRQAITLVDADTGEVIDISLCTVTLTVREFKSKCVALKGSTDSGEVIILSDQDGTFLWDFPASTMGALCQAQYEIGIRIRQDDKTAQLVIATVDVLEGIDQQ